MAVMKPEIAFRTRLLADPVVAAAIAARLYPLRAPESATFPCGVYGRTSTTPEYNAAGVSHFRKGTILLSWWGRNYDALCLLAAAAEDALIPAEGVMEVTAGSNTSTFDFVRLANYSEGVEELNDGSGRPLYVCNQEYEVAWTTLEE
jgi:hypothetical protein